MNIVSNPMHNGSDFEGGPQEKQEEGDGSKMCLNDRFKTELGCRNDHPEEVERGDGKAKKEAKEKEEEEESEAEGGEVEKKEKEEMIEEEEEKEQLMKREEEEKEEMVMKEEMEKEEMKTEKMFADSCVQTGPPSFRMVRFKQEPAGHNGVRYVIFG